MTAKPPVVVEYDITPLTQAEVDVLLFGALASCQDVSLRIEQSLGVEARSDLTPGASS